MSRGIFTLLRFITDGNELKSLLFSTMQYFHCLWFLLVGVPSFLATLRSGADVQIAQSGHTPAHRLAAADNWVSQPCRGGSRHRARTRPPHAPAVRPVLLPLCGLSRVSECGVGTSRPEVACSAARWNPGFSRLLVS